MNIWQKVLFLGRYEIARGLRKASTANLPKYALETIPGKTPRLIPLLNEETIPGKTPRLIPLLNEDIIQFPQPITSQQPQIFTKRHTMAALGKPFPEFKAQTTHGEVNYPEWLGDKWGILFSHPADFTPVCTTELARVVELEDEFEKRNVKIMALSCDDVDSHKGWTADVENYACVKKGCNKTLNYPIIADPDRKIAVKLGMLDPDEIDAKGIPLPARAVFIIGADKKLKLSILYPATTGRNFDEILRVIDSLQLTATKKVATPVDWQSGGKCMVLPNIKADEASKMFPDHEVMKLPSGKEYLRLTPQP